MILDYTDSVVFYLVFYLNQNITQEDFDQLVNNSNQKWSLVQSEFNVTLANLGLPISSIPELSEALPETEGTGATVINEGTSAVNLRSAPNTDAAVVASLETGASATALGKNEAGDWIQVDLNGTLGWVFAENITLNVAIEELHIIDVTP
ncbi:MAG: SH3 domain-containing protein [Bacteroidales bacterium]|nr:SH3 domain-containing protein [Bacteroidales bacterium]